MDAQKPPQPPAADIDAGATTLLREVTPALTQLSGRFESLQQQQAALRQSLQDCVLVDEAAIAKVEAALSQVHIGHDAAMLTASRSARFGRLRTRASPSSVRAPAADSGLP